MNTRARPSFAAVAAASAMLGACSSAPKAESSTAAQRSYAFWPLAPDEPRVQFVRSFRTSDDISPTTSSGLEKMVFGEDAAKAEAVQKPYGVAMRGGRIYVCDIRNASLTILDLDKKQTRLVGVGGVNRLSHPVDVDVADDGMIYVADNERGAVLVYDPAERFSRVIGYANFKPVAVAAHGERLYVCDLTAQTVEVFSRADGKRLGTIGGPGDGDGQFRVPLSVDTDAAGNIYVADMMRCRIQKFAPDGSLVSAMGSLGDYAGSFARPKQIAVDRDGIQYVVDASFQNVQLFNEKNELLMSFGSAGEFPGAMNLPVGIAVCDEAVEFFRSEVHPGFEPVRVVLVTNQFGPDKVSVYMLGRLRGGWTVEQIASASVAVPTGVGTNEERLKLQMQGGEPEPEPDAESDEVDGAGDTPR